MKMTKKLITLALAAMLLLSLAVPAMADDSDFWINYGDEGQGWLDGYYGPGGDVVIPDIVTSISPWVFSNHSSITSVTIPAGVVSINHFAFLNCENLKSVTIPASVTHIGECAFAECPNLTDIYFGGTEAQWAAIHKNREEEPMYNGPIFDEETAAHVTIHYNSTGPDAPTDPTPAVSFSDVSANAYYAEPVAWAVEKGITNGTSSTTFSPDTTCNTAQILTFLWRASDKPEAPAAGLTDVAESAYYYGAAQWAKSVGMISGDTLSPETPCTRASTVMFIWQAAGSPTVDTETSFTDVPAGADYAMAVAWAVENGVTTGTSATAFSPDQTCTRGQIATFLYRAFAE